MSMPSMEAPGTPEAALTASPSGTAVVEDLFAPTGAGLPAPAAAFSLRCALRYKRTILSAFVLTAAPALAFIWLAVTPQYRARATVEVSPSNPRILYKTEDNGLIPMYQQYLNSQVGIISSNQVLQRVIERQDVQATSWYHERPPAWLPGGEETPLERLRENLEVAPRKKTFLIDITFTASSPRDARTIVDAVVEEYRLAAEQRVRDTDVLVLGTLEKTLNELQLAISGREKVADALRRELGTNNPHELIAQKRLRLDELEGRLQEINRELELARWQRQQLEAEGTTSQPAEDADTSGLAPGLRDEALARQQYEQDAEWWRLQQALQDVHLRLAVEGQRLGHEHPRMVQLREQAQRLERELQEREAYLQARAERGVPIAAGATTDTAANLAALARRIASLEKEQALLADALEDQRARFEIELEKATQLVKENEELRKQKQKADLVRTRLDEKETERGPVAMIRVVSRPLTPSKPYHDRRPVLSLLSLLAASACGVGLALVRGNLSRTIQEADQLTTSVRAPFLGLLPLVKDSGNGVEPHQDVEEEHYRMLRTALLSRLDGERGQVALVTSGGSGVGKTTVAIRLARSLARGGRRVLLVDGDIRAPSVAPLMGIRPEPGFIQLLKGEADEAEVLVPGGIPGLDVVTAGGTCRPGDAELLAGGACAAWLARWRDRYDIILLDSPPVLPVADARILARHADGTILVVREGYCRQPDVANALISLGLSGGKLLGTVYIGAHAGSRYAGYGYRGAYRTIRATSNPDQGPESERPAL